MSYNKNMHSLLTLILRQSCNIFFFHRNVFQDLYALSYMWYSATAVLFVVVVGLIVSFLTGRLKLLKATRFYAYMFRLIDRTIVT